ncbi:hypothetical protein IFM89_002264 [Coptis chinensis]|uniref:Replication protein A 70 kDa DNA-binding subunit B/D first OB fold domain-containing protein n=1 Tax=Coptis chinensis TaxID=261450 RepID=A0A835IJY8_9MAGN|nr:hypothetical protein IFM89_002264 [Coptis chinensis]
MSNQQFTDLDKLHTRTDRWKIRVRVTRMWKPINSKKNCAISIEFVMLDSKGYQIHAVLFEKDFQYFDSVVKKDFVQEGSIYTLEKFDVVFAKDYRPVENAYKIHFKEGTLVKIATEEANDISKHMFKFVEFDNIPTKASQLTFLTDVIGVLTKVGKARIAAGKLLKEVVIMNKSGLELPITLWEGMTSIIPEDTMKQPNVVIIATCLKAGYYRGKLGLSTLSGTKIYINMNIQDVKDFKQSFDTKKIVVELEDSGQSGGLSEQDLLIDRRVDIGKLKEIGRDRSCKGTMYTCKATISYIPDSKWFYTSCVSCKKTITGTVCTHCSVGVVDSLAKLILPQCSVTRVHYWKFQLKPPIKKPLPKKTAVRTHRQKNLAGEWIDVGKVMDKTAIFGGHGQICGKVLGESKGIPLQRGRHQPQGLLHCKMHGQATTKGIQIDYLTRVYLALIGGVSSSTFPIFLFFP